MHRSCLACRREGQRTLQLPALALQEPRDSKWDCVQAYTEWLHHSPGPLVTLPALYIDDIRFAAKLTEGHARQAKVQYLVSWTPCNIGKIHAGESAHQYSST